MQTIVDLLEESCCRHANKTALRHKICGKWHEVSYGTLKTASDRIAAGLVAHGFRKGDHVALLAPSCPRWVMAYLSVLKAGGIVVPIDKELKCSELRHILQDSGARVVMTDHPYLDAVRTSAAGLSTLHLLVMLDGADREQRTALGSYPDSGEHFGRDLRDQLPGLAVEKSSLRGTLVFQFNELLAAEASGEAHGNLPAGQICRMVPEAGIKSRRYNSSPSSRCSTIPRQCRNRPGTETWP